MSEPDYLAIAKSNLFVVNSFSGTIGKYTTAGVPINPSLITGLSSPAGIAVWGNELYVASNTNGTVAKYTVDGTLENAALISDLSNPGGLAVSGTDLYVANRTGPLGVGKYTTSGATINTSLIPNTAFVPLSGVAITGSNLFVVSNTGLNDGGVVGKYTTSGTTVNRTFISSLTSPWGIAVGPGPSNIGQIEALNPFPATPAVLDSGAVITSVLSRPGTVNGFTNANYAFLVQDSTGSLAVYDPLTNLDYTPQVGDSVRIEGDYSAFHFKVPELNHITRIDSFSSDNPVPDPILATIPELSDPSFPVGAPAPPAVGEYLFMLNDVTISGESGATWGHGATGGAANELLTVTDADGNSMAFYYWPTSYSACAEMYGTLIPTGPVDITGFVSYSGQPEFVPIAISVPEPSSLGIFAIAGIGFLTSTRRRFRRRL